MAAVSSGAISALDTIQADAAAFHNKIKIPETDFSDPEQIKTGAVYTALNETWDQNYGAFIEGVQHAASVWMDARLQLNAFKSDRDKGIGALPFYRTQADRFSGSGDMAYEQRIRFDLLIEKAKQLLAYYTEAIRAYDAAIPKIEAKAGNINELRNQKGTLKEQANKIASYVQTAEKFLEEFFAPEYRESVDTLRQISHEEPESKEPNSWTAFFTSVVTAALGWVNPLFYKGTTKPLSTEVELKHSTTRSPSEAGAGAGAPKS